MSRGALKGNRDTLALAAVLVLTLGVASEPSVAGTDPTHVDSETQVDPAQAVSAPGHNLVVAPIPVSNPTVGTGLGAVGMLLYSMDPQSPVSFTALGGGYTSNESWLAGAVQKLYFDEDAWRLTGGGGLGQVNYNYFGMGTTTTNYSIPLKEKVYGAQLDLRRRVLFRPLHIGLRYSYANVKTSLGATSGPLAPVLDKAQFDLTLAGLGLVGSWDTSDRHFSPSRE